MKVCPARTVADPEPVARVTASEPLTEDTSTTGVPLTAVDVDADADADTSDVSGRTSETDRPLLAPTGDERGQLGLGGDRLRRLVQKQIC